MQVLDQEPDVNHAIVGKTGATREYSVSTDPTLMTMLSTSFYGNPLRTSIQETMFNAWDAHRMGNCQDTPIDVYVTPNELIIRDYGPGISDSDMTPIYCVYGHSTKRDNQDMTGGFGLGSKSPYSYTSTFTVTSHHDGMKRVYIASRASDEISGKPGLTTLIEVPSEETGLMVSIPLKEGDDYTAYNYVKELIQFSGIRLKLHYHENPEDVIDTYTLEPNEFALGDRNNTNARLSAVYGGVSYSIPHHENYNLQFNVLTELAERGRQCLYIGFASGKLQPLPNREGLNMSDKTIESITAALEVCFEQLSEASKKVARVYLETLFEYDISINMPPHFSLSRAYVMPRTHHKVPWYSKLKLAKPNDISQLVWDTVVDVLLQKPNTFFSFLDKADWRTTVQKTFAKAYSKNNPLLPMRLDKSRYPHDVISYHQQSEYTVLNNHLAALLFPTFAMKHYLIEQELAAIFPDNSSQIPKLRILDGSSWGATTRDRSLKSTPQWREDRINHVRLPAKPQPYQLWFKGTPFGINNLYFFHTVYLAKSVSGLNTITREEAKKHIFGDSSVDLHPYFGSNDITRYIPGYVVSNNGLYDKAKDILESHGLKVIEIANPIKKQKTKNSSTPSANTSKDGYTLININEVGTWASEERIKDPTHFLYVKKRTIADYETRGSKPSVKLLQLLIKVFPKMVIVHRFDQQEALIKNGVKYFDQAVLEWFETQEAKKARFANLCRALWIIENTRFSEALLMHSPLQSTMGMATVVEDDQVFWRDVGLYKMVISSKFLSKAVRTKIITAYENSNETDSKIPKIRQMCIQANFLDLSLLAKTFKGLPADNPPKLNDFIASISRAIKSLKLK